MADSLVISLGAQCWVAKLIRDLFPHMNGPSGVFDWIGTTPAMVAHCLVDDFRTLCNPDRYRAMGRNGGNLQNTFYEEHLRQHVLMNLDGRGLSLADMGLHAFYNYELPALFIHNTEGGVYEMCRTLRRRGRRMTEQLREDGLKVLVWGMAIPYYHYAHHQYEQAAIEEVIQEELRNLHHCLIYDVGVERFCLVGLLVVHGVPQKGMVADQQIPVAPPVRNMFVTMKKIGVISTLHGATFRGHAWAAEKIDIYNFLCSCEDLMYDATIERLAPYTHEVPGTRLATLALADDDADDEVDSDDEDEEDDDYEEHDTDKHDDEEDDKDEDVSFLLSLD